MLKAVAVLYDRIMQKVEEAGLTQWRRDLLAPLSGHVLEVGAGTGRNVSLFPPGLASLVLTEPDRHMRARLIQVVATDGRPADVVAASVETLPFPDSTFDAVVTTLVLCSVRDQAAALGEIRRVLRPDGRFAFLEHVAATNLPRRLRWQRRVEPVWRRLSGNCHLTRSTADAIEAAGFRFVSLQSAGMRKAPALVRPTIRGMAAPEETAEHTSRPAGQTEGRTGTQKGFKRCESRS